jgi:hypothetical protein
MRKILGILVLEILAIGIMAGRGAGAQTRSGPCDRQCLESFVNRYLDAMVAHDAAKAPLAANVKFTENAKVLPLVKPTEGLWVTASGLSDYKFYIADTKAGQIAFIGLVKEGDKRVLLSLRLKVDNQRISEAESVVVRTLNERNLWTLATPPPAFSQALAPEERVSREELVKISNLYFDGIVGLSAQNIPFHESCYRLENGMWTAGPKLPEALAANMPKTGDTQPGSRAGEPPQGSRGGGSLPAGRGPCAQAIDSGVFALIESITPRHTPVVDEERGVTWGVYMFNHPGVKEVKMPDGSIKPAA